MKNLGPWSVAVAALVVCGWVGLRPTPGNAPATINRPSADIRQWPGGAADPGRLIAPATSVAARIAQTAATNAWPVQFHAVGTHYFEFVTRAVRAAYEGDGAAQYYISRALARCEETNDLYQAADNEEEAVSHLSYSPALRDYEREEYSNCRKFHTDNPFKDLPARPGGYSADYWRSRAIASHYPVAMLSAALESPSNGAAPAIAAALATGDSEAMLLFGWTRVTAGDAREPSSILGAAWVLAACRSGADCGPTNEVLPFSNCRRGIELGCTERYTAVDDLTARLSPQDLDRANSLAWNIQSSLGDRDPARLQQYLPL